MRRTLDILPLLLLAATCLKASAAFSQGTLMRPIPDTPMLNDLEDMDSDEDEFEEPSTRKLAGKRLVAEELALSAEEIRARSDYLVSLSVGNSMPWQSYGLEAAGVLRPNLLAGLFVGGGSFFLEGYTIHERSYDTRIRSRLFGGMARYYLPHLNALSVAGSLGYGIWDGHLSPHGSDDAEQDDDEKLSTSFRASGVVGGVSVALSWLWDSGVYLEWTLLGLQSAHVTQRDFSRSSAAAEQATLRDIQGTRVFGLRDLKIGYFF